jgi:hypothetical protein
MLDQLTSAVSPDVRGLLEKALEKRELTPLDAERLLTVHGLDFHALIAAADFARREDCGDDVTYVVCRNINFTNVCYVGCSFCGFARHKDDAAEAFDRTHAEIPREVRGRGPARRDRGLHPGRHPSQQGPHPLPRHPARGEVRLPRSSTSTPTRRRRSTSATRRAA